MATPQWIWRLHFPHLIFLGWSLAIVLSYYWNPNLLSECWHLPISLWSSWIALCHGSPSLVLLQELAFFTWPKWDEFSMPFQGLKGSQAQDKCRYLASRFIWHICKNLLYHFKHFSFYKALRRHLFVQIIVASCCFIMHSGSFWALRCTCQLNQPKRGLQAFALNFKHLCVLRSKKRRTGYHLEHVGEELFHPQKKTTQYHLEVDVYDLKLCPEIMHVDVFWISDIDTDIYDQPKITPNMAWGRQSGRCSSRTRKTKESYSTLWE